jgi:hypothetical protein
MEGCVVGSIVGNLEGDCEKNMEGDCEETTLGDAEATMSLVGVVVGAIVTLLSSLLCCCSGLCFCFCFFLFDLVTVVMTTIDVMTMAAIKTPMEIWRFFLEIIILIVWKQGSGMQMQCTQLTRTVGVGQRLETRQLVELRCCVGHKIQKALSTMIE